MLSCLSSPSHLNFNPFSSVRYNHQRFFSDQFESIPFHLHQSEDTVLLWFNIIEENNCWPSNILENSNYQYSLYIEADLFKAKLLYKSMRQYNYQAVIVPVYFKVNHLVISFDHFGRNLNESSRKIQDSNMEQESSANSEDDHNLDSFDSSHDLCHEKVPRRISKANETLKLGSTPPSFCTDLEHVMYISLRF